MSSSIETSSPAYGSETTSTPPTVADGALCSLSRIIGTCAAVPSSSVKAPLLVLFFSKGLAQLASK